MSVRWWCSVSGQPWTWEWRPYLGVWLLVLATGWLYRTRICRPAVEMGASPPWKNFAAGLLLFWVATDWPLGALGAGYLVSIHTVQYLLLALIIPALFVMSVPGEIIARWHERPVGERLLRLFSRPLTGAVVFNVILLATHMPPVVDTLMASQAGSFLIDMAWLFAGICLWWPAIARVPEAIRMSYPARLGYLLLNTFLPTVPAAFLTFADYPLYGVFELAPPIGGITTRTDQQIAGLSMKLVGDVVLFLAMSVLFFRWHREEEKLEGSLAGSAE